MFKRPLQAWRSGIITVVSTFEPSERSERAYSLVETLRLIVTQTLCPKVGGGRVGLREWLVFTEEIREQLLNMDFERWSYEVMQLVPVQGQSMEQSATMAYEAGHIDKRHYMTYVQGSKNSEQDMEAGEAGGH